MGPINQSRTLVQGALLLTFGAIITKILSAVYRIPFQNIVGDTGFYIYQQVYPFYGVALVLATTGFPVVLSKLYSEEKNKGNALGIKRLMVGSALFLVILGLLSFMLLYFGAEWLAYKMKDPQLADVIKMISFFFLLVPLTALLRGVFQGEGNMKPTAYSQVGEQFVRVGTILLFASILIGANYSLYDVGAGAMLGSVTGGIIGVFILLAYWWVRKIDIHICFRDFTEIFDFKEIIMVFKVLLVQGFAVCISSMLLLLIQLADSLNLYSLLLAFGLDGEEAKGLKGVYDRGQPLIQLGSVVATSMSLALVPLISSERLKTGMESLSGKIHLAIRVSIAIGLGAAVGLMVIIEPTNVMLFENREGSNILAVLSFSIFLSSLSITFIAILQGLGHPLFPAFIVLSGFVIKYFLNLLLVPQLGTYGAAWATDIALLIIGIVLFIRIQQVIKGSIVAFQFLQKVILAAIAMVVILKGYLYVTDIFYALSWIAHERLIAAFQAITAVLLGGFTYMFVVIRTNGFTLEELAYLPFGSKILYLFPKSTRR